MGQNAGWLKLAGAEARSKAQPNRDPHKPMAERAAALGLPTLAPESFDLDNRSARSSVGPRLDLARRSVPSKHFRPEKVFFLSAIRISSSPPEAALKVDGNSRRSKADKLSALITRRIMMKLAHELRSSGFRLTTGKYREIWTRCNDWETSGFVLPRRVRCSTGWPPWGRHTSTLRT